MAIRLGITGSQRYPRPDVIDAFVDRMDTWAKDKGKSVVIVSATEPTPITRKRQARDWPDEQAVRYARGIGMETLTSGWKRKDLDGFDLDGEFRANPASMRRQWLLDHSDILVAFWDLHSLNTALCLDLALPTEKRIEVYGPDGNRVDWDWLGEAVRQAIQNQGRVRR